MDDGVRRALLTGENVLWEGRPYAGLMFNTLDIFMIPFSMLWGGFALFWNVTAWTQGQGASPLPFKLFGLPFLFIGLYVTVGRFVIDMIMRRNLTYAVTDRRILIIKMLGGSSVKSVDLKRLPAFELTQRADGSGTIRFGAALGLFNNANFGMWQPTFDGTPQFIRIADVRSVYELIEKQAAA